MTKSSFGVGSTSPPIIEGKVFVPNLGGDIVVNPYYYSLQDTKTKVK